MYKNVPNSTAPLQSIKSSVLWGIFPFSLYHTQCIPSTPTPERIALLNHRGEGVKHKGWGTLGYRNRAIGIRGFGRRIYAAEQWNRPTKVTLSITYPTQDRWEIRVQFLANFSRLFEIHLEIKSIQKFFYSNFDHESSRSLVNSKSRLKTSLFLDAVFSWIGNRDNFHPRFGMPGCYPRIFF